MAVVCSKIYILLKKLGLSFLVWVCYNDMNQDMLLCQ